MNWTYEALKEACGTHSEFAGHCARSAFGFPA